MKKLWVFGDSYGYLDQDRYEKSKDWHWISLLANQLADGKFITLSHYGAANEWIYYQFKKHVNEMTENDHVVIISTQFDRRWFFPDNVGASNLLISNYDTDTLSRDQKNAVKEYLNHLRNPLLGPLMFDMFCYSLHYLAAIKNLNLLIVPGFEEEGFPLSGKYIVKGSLFDVCKNEIKTKTVDAWYNFIGQKHKGLDPRFGHLSKENHVVLAEKIKNTFLKNEVLDLTLGFHEEIYE
jgi:hypothetical protein